MAKLFAILALNALLLVAVVPNAIAAEKPFELPFVMADDAYATSTQAGGTAEPVPAEQLDDRDVRH